MEKIQSNNDILGYKPDLEIKSRPDLIVEDNEYKIIDNYGSNKSTVAKQFEIHSPSSKVIKLNNLKNKIAGYKSNIKKSLSSHELSIRYFSTKGNAEKENILKINSGSMVDGHTKLEAYSILDKIENEIENVSNEFSISIYGKDVDVDSMPEIDRAYIDKIAYYEDKNEYEYINYFSLYYDTQISFLVGEYADRIDEIATQLNIMYEKNYNSKTDENTISVLETSFNRTNEVLNGDMFKDSESSSNISVALRNIFLAKQELNLYMDSFSELYNLGLEYEFVCSIRNDNMKELDLMLDDLVKSVMLSALNKNDIVDTLEKKTKIRGFFKNNTI